MFLDESILNEESEAMKAVKKHKEEFLKVAKPFLKDIKDAKADDENEETEDDLNLIKGQLEGLIKQIEDAVSGEKSTNEDVEIIDEETDDDFDEMFRSLALLGEAMTLKGKILDNGAKDYLKGIEKEVDKMEGTDLKVMVKAIGKDVSTYEKKRDKMEDKAKKADGEKSETYKNKAKKYDKFVKDAKKIKDKGEKKLEKSDD
jgi:hypothetical protein